MESASCTLQYSGFIFILTSNIRVYSGSSGDIVSNTLNYASVTFLEMILEKGAYVIQDLPGTYNGYIYVLEGSGTFGENQVEATPAQ